MHIQLTIHILVPEQRFDGGTFLIAGPNWHGTVPDGMTKIWSPTNLNWLFPRFLVKGPADTANVNAIFEKVKVTPLSVYLSNSTSTSTCTSPDTTTTTNTMTNSSSHEIPLRTLPAFIPTTGIKIYDGISAAMVVIHSIRLTRDLLKTC